MEVDDIITIITFLLFLISEYLPFSHCSDANGITHLLIQNLQAYLALRGRLKDSSYVKLNVTSSNNQAGIRMNEDGKRNTNSFAIISKKYQQNKHNRIILSPSMWLTAID